MPTSSIVPQAATNRQLGSLGYQSQSFRQQEVMISMFTMSGAGIEYAGYSGPALASATYPASNRALGFMFCLSDSFTVQKVWWGNGTTATTNNADVGVYNEAGTVLLVSGGSTLIATASRIQEVDCTDTVLPAPGRYWCVYNQDGTTATPLASAFTNPGELRPTGVAQFAGAVPLGASFTPAACASGVFPYFGIAGRTQVA